jgi:ketosteroid isomerase-like protein
MASPDSAAVRIARAHIDAWSHHDWRQTRALLAPDVRAFVTSTQRQWGGAELVGAEAYMSAKIKGAGLVEPGSVREISALGDDTNAMIVTTFRIALGPGGAMLTMVRACAYALDADQRIKEERDVFFVQ